MQTLLHHAELADSELDRLPRTSRRSLGPSSLFATESEESSASYIVKGKSSERAAELVLEVGGKVTHELKIIRAVGAKLTDSQRDALEKHPEISRVWEDRQAEVQSAG